MPSIQFLYITIYINYNPQSEECHLPRLYKAEECLKIKFRFYGLFYQWKAANERRYLLVVLPSNKERWMVAIRRTQSLFFIFFCRIFQSADNPYQFRLIKLLHIFSIKTSFLGYPLTLRTHTTDIYIFYTERKHPVPQQYTDVCSCAIQFCNKMILAFY